MKLSFALPKAKPTPAPPPPKPTSAFATDDNDLEPADDDLQQGNNRNSSSKRRGAGGAVQTSTVLSKAARKNLEEQQKIDKTVFEYDEVYDRMKLAEQKAKEKKEADAQQRKPKYISGLLNSAATRKLDRLRAEEKMIQREREQEGDEFADKEAFVTQAYKDQMAEVRRAEEEEKQRNELEQAKKGPTIGMARFYKELLERSEEQHAATVAATTKPSETTFGPNLTISKPPDFAPKSDLELARDALADGKQVELNDDNQIVDKRELLSAGLNLSAPNTRNLAGLRTSRKRARDENEPVETHTAVGAAASRREINARRQREIEVQLKEEEERLAKENERMEKEKRERVVAKRNNQEEIENARTRYMERKRRRLEQEAEEAAKADGVPG